MSELVVACVLRSGGVYTAEWVRRLRDGVARHLTLPHRFVCLSDVAVPCERIPLVTKWSGWWSKIELFRPGLFTGTVVYFDLDTVIAGSLDRLAAYPHHFTMAHEFYRPHFLCSTAMAWRGDYAFIYDAFKADPSELSRRYDKAVRPRIGDQAFIEDQLKGHRVEVFRDVIGPQSIASYKVDACQEGPPPGAAAVAFHGRPKPHQIKTGWVPKAWT